MSSPVPRKKQRTADSEWNDQVNPATSATIDAAMLLPEVLAIIFRYLDLPEKGRTSQVCRDWRDVLSHPSLFRQTEVHLNLEDSVEPLRNLPIMNKLGIRRVVFRCNCHLLLSTPCKPKNMDNALLAVAESLPSLSYLEIDSCHVFHTTIPDTLLGKMPQLAHLKLSCAILFRNNTIEQISQQLTNLATLRLGDSRQLTDTQFRSIIGHLGALKDLEIQGCHHLTDKSIKYLTGLGRQQPVHKPNLETLNLLGCEGLTNQSLFYFSQGQKNLKTLDLSYISQLTDVGLTHLIHLPHLEKLVLLGCYLLSDRGMIDIAKMVNLRTLYTHPINDDGLAFLVEGGSRIETLDLCRSENPGITSLGALHLSRLPRLRELTLPKFDSLTECGMSHLARITSLKKLVFRLSNANDESLAHLVDGGSKITSLDLSLCFQITDLGLTHLSRMASLEELSLSSFGKITDVGLTNLASGRAKITKLNVPWRNFDSRSGQRSLALIASGLFPLRVLAISRDYINGDWLKLVAKNLSHLHTLNVDSKNRIGEVLKFRDSSGL